MRFTSPLGSVRGSALLLLAAFFVAGGFAGALWERSRGPHNRAYSDQRRGGSSGGGSRDGRERRNRLPWFFDSLGLTIEQRDSIETLMRANRPRTDSIFASVMPQVRAVADSTRAAIDRVLTPGQREKLASMPQPRDRRRGGPPGGGSKDSGKR
ncbi:MAG: hypothetical protein ACT4OZ_01320 [Gemmatimonadota bacterium]